MAWVVPAAVALAMVGLAGMHLFFPASVPNAAVSALPFIAHGLAFPLPGGMMLVVVGAVVLVVGLRRAQAGGPPRLPQVLTGGCIVISGLLLLASTSSVALPTAPLGEAAEGGSSMVMVSWNALDHFDGASVEEIFRTLDADVAVLPELDDSGGAGGSSRVRQALTDAGFDADDYDVFSSPPTGTHIAPVTVIVRKDFGSYSSVAVDQTTFGTVHLVGANGSGLPAILAVHTAPPVPRWMPQWRADLLHVRDLAEGPGATAIIAGDLNATVRHPGVGGIGTHADVLARVPASQRGTWPAGVPQILRSTIDHVLVPVESCMVGDTRTVDIPGSDHAAIATTIVIPG